MTDDNGNTKHAGATCGPATKPAERKIAGYGWRRDLPDARDRFSGLKLRRVTRLPATVNLATSKAMPAVYDQGDLGSCTANAIAAAFAFDMAKEKLVSFTPSRLAIYYGEREIERTIESDAGAEIRDGMKVIARTGVAMESLWPYDIGNFARRPSDAYYAAASLHACTVYERVEQTEAAIKSTLAAGFPVVIGISVFDSFESDKAMLTGTIPYPRASESMLGGHAVLLTGYTKTTFRFRNSWGTSWGKNGYGTLPIAYVTNPELGGDYWMLRTVR